MVLGLGDELITPGDGAQHYAMVGLRELGGERFQQGSDSFRGFTQGVSEVRQRNRLGRDENSRLKKGQEARLGRIAHSSLPVDWAASQERSNDS